MDYQSAPGTQLVVVHVARTPGEAQVLVANLLAVGIPACVEGASLVDEFAMSQRLMNRLGVRVMVAKHHEDEAREFLATAPRPSEAELEAQAMSVAAEDGVTSTTPVKWMARLRAAKWPLWVLLALVAWMVINTLTAMLAVLSMP